MAKHLISIDPGKVTGWASWAYDVGGYALIACGVCTPEQLMCGGMLIGFQSAIVELPQVYQERFSKGDPNDLIPLAVQCGHVQAIMSVQNQGQTWLVKPRQWKGQVPKGIHNKRTLDSLQPHDRKIVDRELTKLGKTKGHNMIDAIGLGIYWLGRHNK